jgi:hypothetical protein
MKTLLPVAAIILFARLAHAQVSFGPLDTLSFEGADLSRTYYRTSAFPADFNNDNYDDIVFHRGVGVYWRENTHSNSFKEEVLLFTATHQILSFSNFLDLNNDSYPDVAARTEDGVVLLLSSNGKYVQTHKSSLHPQCGKMILMDYNGDSKIDLLTATYPGIIYLHNDVLNGLNSTSVIYTEENAEWIFSFDVALINDDSRLDLVVGMNQTGLKILFRNPDQTFTQIIYKQPDQPFGVTLFQISDINLDGFKDVVCYFEGSNIHTFTFNNANNTFTEATLFPDDEIPVNMACFGLVDLKNNGKPDIVFNHFFTLKGLENNGSGQFINTLFEASHSLFAFRILPINLNNDGIPDLVQVGDYSFQAFQLDANGARIADIDAGYISCYADASSGDVDKDGFVDLLAVSRDGYLWIHWGNENYHYTEHTKYPIPLNSYNVMLADADEDGENDILLDEGFSRYQVNILKGLGNREFAQWSIWKNVGNYGIPLLIDIDNNGHLDYVSYASYGQVYSFGFDNTNWSKQLLGTGISCLSSADINLDGYVDMFTANNNSKNISILKNDGNGGFVESLMDANGGVPSGIFGVYPFDYNDDGYPDLLAIVEPVPYQPELQIFLNDQLGNFTYSMTHALENMYMPRFVDAVEVNGDGKMDFIVSAWDYNTINVFVNQGGSFVNAGLPFNRIGQSAKSYVDANNDGLIDVFTTLFFGDVFLQLNNSLAEPELVESTITVEQVSAKSVKLKFGLTSADGRLVAITKGNALNFKPLDNSIYNANTNYGLGSLLGTNSYVVEVGASGTLEITNLDIATPYVVTVFEYRLNTAEGNIINYTTDKKSKSFTTLDDSAPEPASVETSITLESIKTNSVKLKFGTTTSHGRLVVITKGKSFSAAPADNIFYNANSSFGSGASLAPDSYVVQTGKLETLEITNLFSSTAYLISVFEYNLNELNSNNINYTSQKKQKLFMTSNIPPQLAAVPDQNGLNLEPFQVTLDVSDPDDLMSELEYTFESSNQAVIPLSEIYINRAGAKPVLHIIPKGAGLTEIAVTVMDTASNSARQSFKYTAVVVGLGELHTGDFSVYPNPFQDQISVKHPARLNSLVIYDARGTIVRKYSNVPESIDVSELPRGFYFFKTADGRFTKTSKH